MYKKILVPMDGSKLSELSIKHLKNVTTGCRTCEVILLTVVEDPYMPFTEYISMEEAREALPAKMREKALKEIKNKARAYLTKAAKALKSSGITVKTVLAEAELAEGVGETILKYIKDNKVELVIMGTHGRSGVMRWALGSVADKIVRHSVAPVLTVSPAGSRKA